MRGLLSAMLVLLAVPSALSAQESDKLQELVDRAASRPATRAAGTVNEIDLSAFQEPRTSTLYIRNGANIRFVNGTLKRAKGLEVPLVEIQGESRLELATNAVLSGNNQRTGYPIVEINEGCLTVDGGSIIEPYDPTAIVFYPVFQYVDVDDTFNSDRPVKLKSDSSHFIMKKGFVQGEITCYVYNADIQILGGIVELVEGYHVTTNSALHLNPSTCSRIYKTNSNRIYLNASISDSLRIDFGSFLSVGDCILEGNGYNITQSDIDKLSMYYYYRKHTPNLIEYGFVEKRIPFRFILKDNKVFLGEAINSNPIQTIENVEPGTLPDRIPEDARDIIEELTITGRLNGTDINLIRSMANTKLRKLDISECSIVSGGDAYFDSSLEPNSKKTVDLLFDGLMGGVIIGVSRETENDIIGDYMFADLTTLQTLILPHTVTTINNGAFMNCPQLTSISFGSGVNTFTSGFLFYGSNNIRKLSFDKKNGRFITIGSTIYDANLKTIIAVSPAYTGTYQITNDVDSIAPYAFAGCMGITSIDFNTSLTQISDYAFCQSGIKSIVLPSTVTSIGKGAFLYCEQLSSITFAEAIERIGYGAFAHCSLKEVDLSMTQITSLGGDEHSYPIAVLFLIYSYHVGVFEGTETLTTIKLPATFQNLGGKVFTSTQISDIYSYAATPPYIYYHYSFGPPINQIGGSGWAASDTFYGVNYETCRLHIPHGTMTKYKDSTGWKEFLNIVDDLPATDPNYIESEDDLQRRLDEIAAEKPKDPATLTICDEGIYLWNTINVRSGCKAIITGGRIRNIMEEVEYEKELSRPSKVAICPAFVFEVHHDAELTFTDITLSLKEGYHFENYGTLTFDNTTITTDRLTICGKFNVYGNNKLPMLYLSTEDGMIKSGIRLLSPMQETWIIDGEWEDYNVEEPYTIVSGYNYTVTKADYAKMQFVNMPDDIEAVYNDQLQVVQLQKKTLECDLQSLVDGLCEPGSGEVPVAPDETPIGCDDPLQCAVDALIDGDDGSGTFPPTRLRLLFNNSESSYINIYQGSSLTIRNAEVEAYKGEGQYIQVSGNLIVDSNVLIKHFHRFIHILPGGHVVWRGGDTEDVDEVVFNEGGTLEIEGGTIRGGITNQGGTIIVHGGTIVSGDGGNDIKNNEGGKLVLYDGTVIGEDGSGSIRSEYDIWMDGSVLVKDVYIKRGARIHVTSRLTDAKQIHFFAIDDFDMDVPIVFGDEGYVLTEADCKYINIELPDGYRWVYDNTRHAIIIMKQTDNATIAGDINGNGEVDDEDVDAFIELYLDDEVPEAGTPEFDNFDANGDGIITLADAVAIFYLSNGLNYDGTDPNAARAERQQ